MMTSSGEVLEIFGDEGSVGLEDSASSREDFFVDLEKNKDDNNAKSFDNFAWVDGEFFPDTFEFKPNKIGFETTVLSSAADMTVF